jgi:hypothetical protein
MKALRASARVVVARKLFYEALHPVSIARGAATWLYERGSTAPPLHTMVTSNYSAGESVCTMIDK